MSPHPPCVRCLFLVVAGTVLVLLLAFTACRSTPTPVATPIAAATATVKPVIVRERLPTAVPTAVTAGKPESITVVAGPASLPPFTIPLPTDWHHVRLTGQARTQQLQTLGMTNPLLLPLLQHFLDGQADDATVVVAWSTDQQDRSGLIAYTIPRLDLSLQRYLTAAEHTLRARPEVTFREATVMYMVSADLPVGYLHYTLMATEDKPVEGHHYLLFDEAAKQLLLLTFVSNSGPMATAQMPSSELTSAVLSATAEQPPFANIVQQVIRQVTTSE